MDKRKVDPRGKPKDCLVEETFKDGTPAAVGSYLDRKRTGEWKTYDQQGVLTKTKRHRSRP